MSQRGPEEAGAEKQFLPLSCGGVDRKELRTQRAAPSPFQPHPQAWVQALPGGCGYLGHNMETQCKWKHWKCLVQGHCPKINKNFKIVTAEHETKCGALLSARPHMIDCITVSSVAASGLHSLLVAENFAQGCKLAWICGLREWECGLAWAALLGRDGQWSRDGVA